VSEIEPLRLSDRERDRIRDALRTAGDPYDDLEEVLAAVYPILSSLPRAMIRALRAFRNEPAAPGVLLLANMPVDEYIPPTPVERSRWRDKTTFVSEATLLGIGQILGEPLGYLAERGGEVIQNLFPVRSEAKATSSESSEIDLGFHTDFSFDKNRPERPYNIYNADYILLLCLRRDPDGEAYTLYAEARDVCSQLDEHELAVLRQPRFQFGASYSFAGGCGADKMWSLPAAILTGPARCPEISTDMLCGVRGIDEEAQRLLDRVRQIHHTPDLARRVCLEPGHLLLIDNRKGAHARTAFAAYYDGRDRWLQRIYVRRSLWELRSEENQALRVF
jgi:L-asparagine oxygenase